MALVNFFPLLDFPGTTRFTSSFPVPAGVGTATLAIPIPAGVSEQRMIQIVGVASRPAAAATNANDPSLFYAFCSSKRSANGTLSQQTNSTAGGDLSPQNGAPVGDEIQIPLDNGAPDAIELTVQVTISPAYAIP